MGILNKKANDGSSGVGGSGGVGGAVGAVGEIQKLAYVRDLLGIKPSAPLSYGLKCKVLLG